jgi:hypothetical protein
LQVILRAKKIYFIFCQNKIIVVSANEKKYIGSSFATLLREFSNHFIRLLVEVSGKFVG